MLFLTATENLKIEKITSQLSYQRFIEFGYFGVHFSVTQSRAARTLFASFYQATLSELPECLLLSEYHILPVTGE